MCVIQRHRVIKVNCSRQHYNLLWVKVDSNACPNIRPDKGFCLGAKKIKGNPIQRVEGNCWHCFRLACPPTHKMEYDIQLRVTKTFLANARNKLVVMRTLQGGKGADTVGT